MPKTAEKTTAYDAARLAYGAADALVKADTWARTPILAAEAASHREAARQALIGALDILDAAA